MKFQVILEKTLLPRFEALSPDNLCQNILTKMFTIKYPKQPSIGRGVPHSLTHCLWLSYEQNLSSQPLSLHAATLIQLQGFFMV